MRKEIMSAMLVLKEELVNHHQPCGGMGWLEPVEPGVNNPCECMVVFHYLNALVEAKVPRDYWWLSIDNLEIDKGFKTFCNWYNRRMDKAVLNSLGVLFLGPNGIGKTSMQCAIGKEAIVRGYNVQYFTAQQYIESRKDKDNTLTKEYESGEVILLDELDKVYIKSRSDYVTKTIEDFLRRKTADGATFIICTNHDQETLQDVFGQSTMSMLKRHLKFVDVDGDDYGDKLQSRWNDIMESDRNYYDDRIVSMATRFNVREMKEDALDW